VAVTQTLGLKSCPISETFIVLELIVHHARTHSVIGGSRKIRVEIINILFTSTCFLFLCLFLALGPNIFFSGLFSGPPLWSSGQSSWLQIRRPGFDSRHYQKKEVVGLERGPLSLVSTTEELLDRKVAAPV
jgi:hypothetical protein